MKNYYVMTLFPDMVEDGLNTSIMGKAIEKKIINVETVDIRAFTKEKHGHVDDYPYGGGAGMVMQAQPVYDAYRFIEDKVKEKPYVIYMTPQGKVFNQAKAKELSHKDNIVFLCGHYEGIDERVLEMIVDENMSIGDYVLTGGEMPAMVMIDSISRLVPGVLGNDASWEDESFSDGLLEYPQYTRPEVFMEKKVPGVLMTGHHANIEKWRHEQSLKRTIERRPDLLSENKGAGCKNDNDTLIEEMIKYYKGAPKRIQHFLKVYEFASMIGRMENIDSGVQHILETAAIVHDIGIKKCEKKYGKCDGSLQEKEGPAIAAKMLRKLGYNPDVIARCGYLIAHHHTYSDISGIDYRILVEADFLVNLYEDNADKKAIITAYDRIFRTNSGKMLCRTMFALDTSGFAEKAGTNDNNCL